MMQAFGCGVPQMGDDGSNSALASSSGIDLISDVKASDNRHHETSALASWAAAYRKSLHASSADAADCIQDIIDESVGPVGMRNTCHALGKHIVARAVASLNTDRDLAAVQQIFPRIGLLPDEDARALLLLQEEEALGSGNKYLKNIFGFSCVLFEEHRCSTYPNPTLTLFHGTLTLTLTLTLSLFLPLALTLPTSPRYSLPSCGTDRATAL